MIIRIGNIEFKKADYIDDNVEHKSYEIVQWVENPYYNRQSEFTKEGDYYCESPNFRVHKSCFENKEYCFTIAQFKYQLHQDYVLSFIDNLPLKLSKEDRDIFFDVIEYGFNYISKHYE